MAPCWENSKRRYTDKIQEGRETLTVHELDKLKAVRLPLEGGNLSSDSKELARSANFGAIPKRKTAKEEAALLAEFFFIKWRTCIGN